ncbi:nicotinate-nucleotide--dimethylbenzimidazole phosphoribosyltransferase [Paludifilum halophilum]|uniref:Nicotinate-nucleotide--dimethylbenzimidazole phosphoribosyltransferase n=1 Tax=Paludifilum halophilum TaxID=1642702 RepID=A0A235B5Y9_9BACL|nr:nicotinate-nucleotide--dimethylbenzimidazole phosphoribosyltransferase [Paludifilum halophilum]OYD07317.1 nicotinate-nucleotide--dimethylbenzimidazole phosphoribosyltransferase [Paludifilum halophilum]
MERWNELQRWMETIPPVDVEVEEKARKHVDNLTKPLGALGQLEEIVVRLAGMTGEVVPSIRQKATVVMCGDHGVTEEGVSAYPREVTGMMIHNFCRGKAAVNVLSKQFGSRVWVVDVGSRLEELPQGVIPCKIRAGTDNMAQGPAMTRKEAVEALWAGVDMACRMKEEGVQLLAVGEMGIGNTTAGTALTAALTEEPVAGLVGPGTGLDPEALERKRQVIERSLAVNQPDPKDPLDALAKVGGLEIAAMAGVALGASALRLPVVIDGWISTVAAWTAVRMAPRVQPYLIASHLSTEPGHRVLLDRLRLNPLIRADMRLGEGSGAVLAFPLLDGAVAAAEGMATFAELGL